MKRKYTCCNCGATIEGDIPTIQQSGWATVSRRKGKRLCTVTACPAHRSIIEADLKEEGQ